MVRLVLVDELIMRTFVLIFAYCKKKKIVQLMLTVCKNMTDFVVLITFKRERFEQVNEIPFAF